MGKDFETAVLLDFYGDLLTEKQFRTLDLYYNEDLSLAEIAEPLGISRQGVRDSIKRGEKQLYDLEETLGLVKRFRDVKTDMTEIESMFKELREYIHTFIHSDKLSSAVDEISERLERVNDKL